MNLIAGNWKMSMTPGESIELINRLVERVGKVKNPEILVCPPFTSLALASDALRGSEIKLGAQNMHFEEKGAFTGEISASMLKDVNCKYVILGHSERRQFFGETDALVNKKVKAALAAGLKPIVCMGENLKDRENGKEEQVVGAQFKESLKGVTNKQVVIAYEPIWAIGTGKTATPAQAQKMHAFLRKLCEKQFKAPIRILYGGSVKADNVDAIIRQKDIDGCLVGGASLDPTGFARIVKYK